MKRKAIWAGLGVLLFLLSAGCRLGDTEVSYIDGTSSSVQSDDSSAAENGATTLTGSADPSRTDSTTGIPTTGRPQAPETPENVLDFEDLLGDGGSTTTGYSTREAADVTTSAASTGHTATTGAVSTGTTSLWDNDAGWVPGFYK